MNSKLQVKKLNSLAKLPTRGSTEAAGLDLYAATAYDIEIPAHDTVKFDTGISIAIPEGMFGAVFARSGIATRQGLRPANCVGVIDSDYRGSVIVALHNDGNYPQIVAAGSRIAQLVILPYIMPEIVEVDELTATERGENGFGSTGIN